MDFHKKNNKDTKKQHFTNKIEINYKVKYNYDYMKDLPHHIKKLNRRVIRSSHREDVEEEMYAQETIRRPQTEHQRKKQAKARLKKTRESRVPSHLTPEERNKKMAKRVPIFDRLNGAKPKHAKPSRKKTPR